MEPEDPVSSRAVIGAAPRAVSVVRAEFVDPTLEAEFVDHHLVATAQRVRTTTLLGAVIFFAFTLPDLARLGFGTTYVLLLLFRAALVVGAAAFTSAVRRNPTVALSWPVVTTLEVATIVVQFVVMVLRPDELPVHDLGIAVTLMACFLLVPNRFVVVLVMGTVSSATYLLLATFATDQPVSRQVASAFTIASFLVLGAMTANQLQRARREEFLSLRQAQRTNDLLVEEIARRRVLEDDLTWLATHDALTDLLNRRAFYEQADREAARARRSSDPMSVLVIDADEFKAVNDRFGHHAGDEALRRIASVCAAHLRAGDVVGRIGGEEFAAVMPGASLELAHIVAERLRVAVTSEAIDHHAGPIALSVSIGVTEVRPWEESMLDGIRRADAAMYAAKAAGRNRVVAAEPDGSALSRSS